MKLLALFHILLLIGSVLATPARRQEVAGASRLHVQCCEHARDRLPRRLEDGSAAPSSFSHGVVHPWPVMIVCRIVWATLLPSYPFPQGNEGTAAARPTQSDRRLRSVEEVVADFGDFDSDVDSVDKRETKSEDAESFGVAKREDASSTSFDFDQLFDGTHDLAKRDLDPKLQCLVIILCPWCAGLCVVVHLARGY
ncbi:hypothetical protein PRIPAC_80096 [Pristionchus pacificus]|uniref:Uncharacterized protein n=1 Tax=Pristionchus pacificus TaxID=54126 RepID=A0A2A6BVU0_PRIPA|nr:hypothetical protein PRIPAC_80096 [Pristionchus pacificus]|eukprot:PDM69987.1 hypothetical protein PRIPAC_49199 [Pristionchus pacificus]